jgi:hypothetical protein
MTKQLLFVCGFSLLLLISGAARAGAQTVAAGPYYATPSWNQRLTCSAPANCPRFVVLSNWNNGAVLDPETGLVWEKQPTDQKQTWMSRFKCISGPQPVDAKVGDRLFPQGLFRPAASDLVCPRRRSD